MILVDTNFLVALSRPRDQLHSRAVAWSLAVRSRTLVTEYVVLEAVNLLSAPMDRSRVPTLVSQLQADKHYRFVHASRSLLEQGLELFAQRPDKHWSLTDCVSFVLMTKYRMRAALTFDHHFEEAGFQALLRADPPSSTFTS